MIKEHINLVKQHGCYRNPKYTFWNREGEWVNYYQLIKVNKDGYLVAEDKKHYN